jgi:ParB-like chromosome segregation protein Spo0J
MSEMIPIDSIVVRDRLVTPPEEAPELLVKSMAELGLIHPIGVRKVPIVRDGKPTEEYEIELVHGAKRLAAAKALDWTEIKANPEPEQDNGELAALDAKLKQIGENLHREHWQEDAVTRAEHLVAWNETLARKRALVDATKPAADGIDDAVTPKRGRGRHPKGSGAKAAAACPEALYEFMCVERVRTAFMEHLKQSESRAAA